jgi:hypothetical protein
MQCGSQFFRSQRLALLMLSFFGYKYKVQDGKWCLDDDRKQAVTDNPNSTDLKRMQRCLVVGIFLSERIPG